MSDASGLLQNDPLALLSWLSGLHYIAVGCLTALVVPGVLGFWSGRNKTLRLAGHNPPDHGFLSAINVYLLILPFLNYAIFHYYRVYDERIRYFSNNHVLHLDLPRVVAAAPPPMWFSWLLLSLCFVLGIVALLWNSHIRRLFTGRHSVQVTTWLRDKQSPRPIAWYLYLVIYPLQLYLVLSWASRNYCFWTALAQLATPAPYDPDQMYGWKPAADLANYAFLVVTLVGLLVAVWVAGARRSLGKDRWLDNPGHIAAAIGVIVLGPIAVVAPLHSAHDRIRQAREIELGRLAPQIESLSSKIYTAAAKGKHDELKTLSEARDAVQSLYDGLQSAATWPVDRTLWDVLALPFLSPILLAVLEEFAKKYLVKDEAAGLHAAGGQP